MRAFAASCWMFLVVITSGCSDRPSTNRSSPVTPTAVGDVSAPSAAIAEPVQDLLTLPNDLDSISSVVAFPPRDQPFRFRLALEDKYRTGLGRGLSPSFVNPEGDVVWTQEYLRFRVNNCPHSEAVMRVFREIDGSGLLPLCGPGPPAGTVAFPPRNESFDFRRELEVKYRDELRAAPSQTRVDIEGQVVWMQEYLRYRVNGCGDVEAQDKVFAQIDGGGVQPVCGLAVIP